MSFGFGRGLGKNEVEWTGNAEIRKTELLAVDEGCTATFWRGDPLEPLASHRIYSLLYLGYSATKHRIYSLLHLGYSATKHKIYSLLHLGYFTNKHRQQGHSYQLTFCCIWVFCCIWGISKHTIYILLYLGYSATKYRIDCCIWGIPPLGTGFSLLYLGYSTTKHRQQGHGYQLT